MPEYSLTEQLAGQGTFVEVPFSPLNEKNGPSQLPTIQGDIIFGTFGQLIRGNVLSCDFVEPSRVSPHD